MRMSLEIVIVAIVLIVVAAVVLAFFGEQIFRLSGFTHEESLCINEFVGYCTTMGDKPTDWRVPKYRDSSGERKTCEQIMSKYGGCDCEEKGDIYEATCPKNPPSSS